MPYPQYLIEFEQQLKPWEYEFHEGHCLRGQAFYDPDSGKEKKTIHFLHGNGLSAMTYAPLLERLSREYSLIAADIYGHGRSDHGLGMQTWEQMRRHTLNALRSRLEPVEKVVGAGHSLGGVFTLLMAAEHPELFDRVIVLDPPLFPSWLLFLISLSEKSGFNHLSPPAKQAMARREHWRDRDEAYQYFHGRGMFKTWQDEATAAYVRHCLKDEENGSGVTLACPKWLEAGIFSSHPERLWSLVRKIQVPTTVVLGDQSFSFMQSQANKAARINPHIDFRVVEGDHCFMQQFPESTADLMLELIAAG